MFLFISLLLCSYEPSPVQCVRCFYAVMNLHPSSVTCPQRNLKINCEKTIYNQFMVIEIYEDNCSPSFFSSFFVINLPTSLSSKASPRYMNVHSAIILTWKKRHFNSAVDRFILLLVQNLKQSVNL